MTYPIPRIQGRAIEKDGGWSFEFLVSFLGSNEGYVFWSPSVYSTKEEAVLHLKKACQDVIKCFADCYPDLDIDAASYIDVKTNEKRRWDKKDEN